MKIIAAVARSTERDFSIETVELDEPRPDEIRVRITAVGVCHTDLVAKTGALPLNLPAVLGHEGAGVVDKIGSGVTRFVPGDRVAISFRSCGICERCMSGSPSYCDRMPELNYAGVRADGSKALQAEGVDISSNFFGQSSFAAYALTYERNLVKLPADIPLEIAAPLGCGVQTGAGGVIRALACERGSSILVTGGGAVGLSAVMGAVIRGCSTIIVVEPLATRRALALDLGATHVIDPTVGILSAAVREIVPRGVHYAFDTTGRAEILNAAVACLAPKGVLGMAGIPMPGTAMPGPLELVFARGLTVRGVIEGDSDPETFLPELIAHWRAGRLPLEKLIRTFPLGEINAAIAAQHRGECVKIVLLTEQL